MATSLHLGAPDRKLFAWYHQPAPGPAGAQRSCGVVLCNPVGDDYIRAHRTLRHLAERLARAGFAVLRFDFHGTGDSSGDERDPERVRTWLDDVGAAVDELRKRSGKTEIALLGLRLGATLAMAAAAERGGVDSLVLWGAYLDGKAFVTEATRLHKMHKMLEPQSFASGPKDHPEGQEALGFLLTHATIAGLGGLDLLAVQGRPARKVLVLSAGNVPGEDRLLQHLSALGAEPECRHVSGPKFLTMTPHKSTLPEPELEVVISWLSQHHPAAPGTDAKAPGPPPGDDHASALRLEQPLSFGKERPLFGVLVKPPEDRRRPDRPAIIMMNAGCVHRIGPHRFYVAMAREWARLGFYVLRVDLSGIGDSPAGPGEGENLCYPRDVERDVDEVMRALSAETRADRFILMGLCSGGDIAFKKGIGDPRVKGAVMMNPRTFCVNDLGLIAAYQHARYYQGSFFRKEKWMKALRGEVDFRRVARLMLPKVKSVLRNRLGKALALVQRRVAGLGLGAGPKGPVPGPGNGRAQEVPSVPACLQLMAERGVDTFLLVSEHDPGVDYVDSHFGKDMQALGAVQGFRREDIKGTDHTFTSLWAQQHVREMITDHLTRRYLT